MATILYKGGPCCCHPNRRVRYVIPFGVEGARAEVSCREDDEHGPESLRWHAPPDDLEYAIHIPELTRADKR